jgi:hypothetical protein
MQPKAQRAKSFRRIDVTLGLNRFRAVASENATFSIGMTPIANAAVRSHVGRVCKTRFKIGSRPRGQGSIAVLAPSYRSPSGRDTRRPMARRNRCRDSDPQRSG